MKLHFVFRTYNFASCEAEHFKMEIFHEKIFIFIIVMIKF